MNGLLEAGWWPAELGLDALNWQLLFEVSFLFGKPCFMKIKQHFELGALG